MSMNQSFVQIGLSQYDNDLRIHNNIAAQALEISRGIYTEDQYKTACSKVIQIDEMLKVWENKIAPSIKTAHQLHKQLNDLKNDIGAPLRKARMEILQPAILKWERSEEEKRRIDQERVNREMRKQEEIHRLELAAEMEKSGKVEEANAMIAEPVVVHEIVLPKTTKHEGIQYRTIYSAEVADLKLLCKAVADGLAPTEFIIPNISALNALVRNLKESISSQWEKYGLKVRSEKVLAVGGR